jgi:hypothetical protein
MAFNLIRNARMFFTTNVNSVTGVVQSSGFTTSNTREIQVLDGLSFSQATGTETVTVNEAGTNPARGQRQFNTSLEPVELTFSTYIRPKFNNNATSDWIGAEEEVLWNAFAAGYVDSAPNQNELIGSSTSSDPWVNTNGDSTPVSSTGAAAAWTVSAADASSGTPVSTLAMTNSNKNQLHKFGVIILLDASSYIVDNCVVDQATIDFGLDAISTIAWTVRGATLRSVTAGSTVAGTFTGLTGSYKQKVTDAPFLANKLSSVTLQAYGASPTYGSPGGTSYTLALTGGSITFANNVTYLTPANLGVVNKPATYFTGTRAISGTLNCYLKSGAGNSAGLLADMLTNSATDVEPDFSLTLNIGGGSTAATRVQLAMRSAVLSIPTINTEQVVSQTITFTAQGSTSSALDLEEENEITVKYYSAAV